MAIKRVIFYPMALAFIALLVGVLLPPVGTEKMTRVRIRATEIEEQIIASVLKELLTTTNLLSHYDNQDIRQAILSTNDTRKVFFRTHRTNTSGEALDRWGTAYQIEIVQRTNFVVRSAGPNRTFGDKDDIILDSLKPSR